MKFLLWAVVGLAIVMWLLRSKKATSGNGAFRAGKADSAGKATEPMIQCAHCGVHVPVSEAVATVSGAVFCSEEHRLKHVGP